MKANKEFNKICDLLMNMDAVSLSMADFSNICKLSGDDIYKMNNNLYGLFGMSGDELIEELRKCSFVKK